MAARMANEQVVIADLPPGYLGETDGNTIYIDRTAAGYGWFVDPTPNQDEEFAATSTPGTLTALDPQAVDKIDLLTVVEHELGHVIGLGDLGNPSSGLMDGTLPVGVRRVPDQATVDAVLAEEV